MRLTVYFYPRLPDDFYYDSLLGEFVAKDSTRLANYFYDPVDEVFRKQGNRATIKTSN